MEFTRMISLSPYQQEAIDFLRSKNGRGLCYADVGTGKSFIGASFIDLVKPARTLILAPKSALEAWNSALSLIDRSGVTLTNYEQLKNLDTTQYECVIADECQRMSNPVSLTARFIHKHLRDNVRYRVALSGTPSRNNRLEEYFSVIHWLNPEAFGVSNWWQFRSKWCRTLPQFYNKIVGYNDKERLMEIIKNHFIRIKRDVLDLPELTTTIHYVDLYEEEREIYDKIKKESIIELQGQEITIPNVLAKLTRLRQFLSGDARAGGSDDCSKREALRRLLRSDRSTLCFSESSATALALAQEYGSDCYYGGTSGREREQIVARFNSGVSRLLFLTSAGSEGINLQKAERVLHFDMAWNPAAMEQRTGRMYRRGQEKNVEEVLLIVRDSVDEWMYELVQRKATEGKKLTSSEMLDILKR